MGLKFNTKVLGKEFEGDSPQCGEMSRSDRGDSLLLGGRFFKRFSLNDTCKCSKNNPTVICFSAHNTPSLRIRRLSRRWHFWG